MARRFRCGRASVKTAEPPDEFPLWNRYYRVPVLAQTRPGLSLSFAPEKLERFAGRDVLFFSIHRPL